jgi:hypothetical protein
LEFRYLSPHFDVHPRKRLGKRFFFQ